MAAQENKASGDCPPPIFIFTVRALCRITYLPEWVVLGDLLVVPSLPSHPRLTKQTHSRYSESSAERH